MHLFKEENVQTTYPKRKPTKPASHYVLSFALLAIMVLLINAMFSMALPVRKGSTPPAVAYLHKSDKAIAMVPLRGTKAEEKYHGPASCWRRIAEVNHKPGFVLHET